jgi:hypothetical protein
MQFDVSKHRDFFLAADTDSAIFTLHPILEKKLGKDYTTKLSDEEIINEIKIYLKKYSDKLNNGFLNKFSKDKFNVINHKFNWKTENILKAALWTGKRRYAQYIIEKEGVIVEELDLKGLELMKSNMNKTFKEFGTNFIKQLLFDTPKPQLDQSIIDFYKSIKTIEPKLLGRPTGVSNINKYIKRSAMSGEIFSELTLGAPINSKCACKYNDLLKFKKLDKQYESIIEGDKIFMINLKENPYHIDVIGIPNNKIPEDINNFINEYIDIEHIFNSMIGEKLKELYSDLKLEFPSLNPKVGKFFKFL